MLFVFMLCLGLLTQFVYFKYDLASCVVLLICWFFLILCSHHFLCERAMCSLDKYNFKITIIVIIVIIRIKAEENLLFSLCKTFNKNA